MSRKIKTTPDQREILWLLAETGERSLLVILNTLTPKFGNAPGEFLKRIEKALNVVEKLGCTYLEWQFQSETRPVLVNERAALSLKQFFLWDNASREWKAAQQGEFVDINVRLTNGGVEVLDSLAAESGGSTPVWKRPVEH